MATDICVRIIKWVLVLFNILLLCAGAIAIGLGAWALASEFGAEKLKDLMGSELFRGPSIAIIVAGSVLVFIALCGALGAILENRVLLGVYLVINILVLILFVVTASIGYTFRDIMTNHLMDGMEFSLKIRYSVYVNSNEDNADVTRVWDEIQEKLECCGVTGRTVNSEKSWFLWQQSVWFTTQPSGSPKRYVPDSCCKRDVNITLCVSINPDPSKPVQTSNSQVTKESEYVSYRGCYDQLADYIKDRVNAVAGISIAIICVLFLCILFAVCVCVHIGRQSLAL